MQTPAQAAPSMLCTLSTKNNAWCINATGTGSTHSAVHCNTLYAGTIQQCSNSYCTNNNLYHALLCYRSIAIYAMHSCPIPSVGGWRRTSSGCLISKRQCPSTPHQYPRSLVTWLLPSMHIHMMHIFMYTYMHIYISVLQPTSKRPCSEVGVSQQMGCN